MGTEAQLSDVTDGSSTPQSGSGSTSLSPQELEQRCFQYLGGQVLTVESRKSGIYEEFSSYETLSMLRDLFWDMLYDERTEGRRIFDNALTFTGRRARIESMAVETYFKQIPAFQ